MEKSIFRNTLDSLCGAHDKSPWDEEFHALGWRKFVIPDDAIDTVDTVDYEGW